MLKNKLEKEEAFQKSKVDAVGKGYSLGKNDNKKFKNMKFEQDNRVYKKDHGYNKEGANK